MDKAGTDDDAVQLDADASLSQPTGALTLSELQSLVDLFLDEQEEEEDVEDWSSDREDSSTGRSG